MALNQNEFGRLIKAYRQQRNWTQAELADRWGHTKGYISQIELGRRKVDSPDQLVRLADILDIPQEKLDAIGRGIPERKKAALPLGENSAIVQMLLAPGRDMVRLAYLTWQADQHPAFEESLRSLIYNLEQAMAAYQGEFRKPAQQLLAYAHQMQGKIALDRLNLPAASGHFSAMIELGHELNDADIITVGMSLQGIALKKRGRYEQAIRCFEAARPYADVASPGVQGMHAMLMARAFYDSGKRPEFERAIATALEIASALQGTITSLANEFSLDDVLCEQASGLTELGEPERALAIYREADRLRPNRLLRERGSFLITCAQAYLQAEFDLGVEQALQGIALASEYRSRRHIGWIEKSYQRAMQSPAKSNKKLIVLRDALADVREKQEEW